MADDIDRTRFSYRHHSFLVFVDGVEIPWTFLQIKTTLGSPTTVEIFVEPDDLIERLRPRSYVHIFMSDPYNEGAPDEGRPDLEYDRNSQFDKERYYLCFEGELQGITESESAMSRSMVLSCSDMFSIINNTTLDLVQVNSSIHIPMVNGSTFYGSFVGLQDASILKYVLYAAMGFGEVDTEDEADRATLESQVAGTKDQQFPLLRDGRQGSSEYFYFDAVRLALKYFMQFNASYRNQAMRTRLFDKMFGISDQTFQRFMERRVAQLMITNGFENVPYASLGELMMYTLGVGLHNYTSMLFPVPNDEAKEGAWNQYLFLPNLYYAVPPACNWIFPEHIQSLNASRFFLQEPTRIGVRDPMVGNFGLLHLAPSSLTDTLTGGAPPVDPKDASTLSTEAFQASNPNISITPRNERELDGLSFRYTENKENPVTNPNLLRMMTAVEIEKGIVFRYSDISIEYFAGIFGATDSIGTDSAFRDTNKTQETLDDETKSLIREKSPYIQYTQAITDYRLTIERLNRDLSLAGPFNPWAVAGFPAVVCRANRSYRGLLVGINHTIGSSGEAQSVYQLAYTTLFRPKSVGAGTVKEIEDLSRAANLAKKKSATSSSDLKKKLPFNVISDNTTDIIDAARSQINGLGDTLNAVRVLRSDVASWRKAQNLNPVVIALATFKNNISTEARNSVGGDIDEVITNIGQLNGAIASTQNVYEKQTEEITGSAFTQEQIDWFKGHSIEFLAHRPVRTVSYYPTVETQFGMADHVFDYPTVAIGATTGTTTAGPTNSPIPLSINDYFRGLENTEVPLEYSRDGTKVVASASKQVKGVRSNLSSIKVFYEGALLDMVQTGELIVHGLDGVQYFEKNGTLTCSLGRSVRAVNGEIVDQGIITRVVSRFEEIVDALIDRAINKALSFTDLRQAQDYTKALESSLDKAVKDDGDAEAKTALAQKAIGEIADAQDSLVESVPIMPFANPQLIDPTLAEEQYEKVLGKSTVLKDRTPGSISSAFKIAEDEDPRLLRNVGAIAFTRMASSVFSFDDENEGNTLYDSWVSKGSAPEGINKFTRRTDAMTLREFLKRTNLTLIEETARFGPFTRSFYRMSGSLLSADNGSSYFDKLVGNNTSITGSTPADEDIKQARMSIHNEQDQPFLYEARRQKTILDYSRVHFVPRGLRGK